LRDLEGLGRVAKVLRVRNLKKGSQLPQFHVGNPFTTALSWMLST
jgi:hypothetical protein